MGEGLWAMSREQVGDRGIIGSLIGGKRTLGAWLGVSESVVPASFGIALGEGVAL